MVRLRASLSLDKLVSQVCFLSHHRYTGGLDESDCIIQDNDISGASAADYAEVHCRSLRRVWLTPSHATSILVS
jgi:hypothetical protein